MQTFISFIINNVILLCCYTLEDLLFNKKKEKNTITLLSFKFYTLQNVNYFETYFDIKKLQFESYQY